MIHGIAGTVRTRCGAGRLRPEWLLAGGVLCLFWLVSRRYTGPAYLSDEIGYLGHAALLAGYELDAASSWHAGYSLLLAPLFRLFSEPADIWQGVMVLNAAMWAGSFILLLQVMGRFFPHRAPLQRIAAVVAAAIYPTWLTMSGYAFPTTVVTFVFLLGVLTALRVDLRDPRSVVPHSVAVGFLYWIHPTGLAVVGASILAVAVVRLRDGRFAALLVHVVIVAAVVLAYERGLHPWLLEVGTAPGFVTNEHYPSYVSVLSRMSQPRFWLTTVVAALGQASYLTVGSLGLAVAGFAALVHPARKSFAVKPLDRDGEDIGALYAALFVLLSIVAVVLMGSAGFAATDGFSSEVRPRVDQWIYGRYAEGVFLPFLAIGFLATCPRRWLPALPAALIVFGLLLSLATVTGNNRNLVNITAFWPRYLIEMPIFLLWMAVGGLGVFLFQVARQEGRAGKRIALVLLVVVALMSAVNAAEFHQRKLEGNRPSGFVGITRTNFEPGCCVGFNPKMPADAVLYQEQRFQLHLFYLYDYVYGRMHATDWLRNCEGPLFTYEIEDLRDEPGVVLLGQEVRSGLYLVAKERAEGFQLPYEDPTARTFYPAEGWTLYQDVVRYGASLKGLPSQVGKFRSDMIVSTGREGLLVYGPNVVMQSGLYSLVVRGSAANSTSAWVEVVSGAGNDVHATFSLSDTGAGETGVLSSALFYISEDVANLEVRVHVGADDEIRLLGYELVPFDMSQETADTMSR